LPAHFKDFVIKSLSLLTSDSQYFVALKEISKPHRKVSTLFVSILRLGLLNPVLNIPNRGTEALHNVVPGFVWIRPGGDRRSVLGQCLELGERSVLPVAMSY
jgi:hypothetical protein